MKARLPPQEELRLATLRSCEVLDTASEPLYNDLTMLAAQICGAPVALVSLVDRERQWFKSHYGMTVTETSRDASFCAHAILQAPALMVVEDTHADPRFSDNEFVTGALQIRFYAGAPLVAPNGQPLGTLCVLDTSPRQLAAGQRNALQALSRQAAALLDSRRQAKLLVENDSETRRMLVVAEQSRRALLGVLEDEQRAGQRLRESEERFRQLAETINEVFWITDVSKTRVLYVSPAYETIWGRPAAELYASTNEWVDAIHQDDRERVVAAAKAQQALGTYDEVYRILRPDGTIRWIKDKAFPVKDAAGVVQRLVGVAEDITEARLLEERFLRAQRMEAVGTLSSGIAHDLNNILAPMLMIAPILTEKLADPQDVELLMLIDQGARRGANIIKQLLTFSRGVDGERGVVQPRHLLKEMMAIMRETFPRTISLRENLAADLWPIMADATQLHQVLMNLCVNARDALARGGEIQLTAENLQIGPDAVALHPLAKTGPYVKLTVADNGEGIEAANLGRIFEPFFTTKEVGKGTGLGLSTVVGIVRSHGGFVQVTSERGRGSAFKIHLPAVPDAVADRNGVPVTPLQGQMELILLVDDEASIRRTLTVALELRNYRVVTAADGAEAVDLFRRHAGAVDLLLTDLMMPGISGVNLIRTLRALQPDLRVVAMSGLHDQDRREELGALRVDNLVAKPFTSDEIVEAVHAEFACLRHHP